MNRMHNLSLTLLLAAVPASLFASAEVEQLLRHQNEMCTRQKDTESLVLLVAAQGVPASYRAVGNCMTKVGLKQVAARHVVPDFLKGSMRADIPGLGECDLLTEDQLLEVAAEVVRCCLVGETANDQIARALTLTYVREKVLQAVSHVFKSLCGECPAPASAKSSWMVSTTVKEFLRYHIDKYIRTAAKLS